MQWQLALDLATVTCGVRSKDFLWGEVECSGSCANGQIVRLKEVRKQDPWLKCLSSIFSVRVKRRRP